MNCFYHQAVVAVGACKSCGKGLCSSCAVDLGKGLACRGRCEQDVAGVIKLIDLGIQRVPISTQLVDNVKKTTYTGALFHLVCGLLFLGFASYRYCMVGFKSPDILPWGFGSLFLVLGFYSLNRAIRLNPVTHRRTD